MHNDVVGHTSIKTMLRLFKESKQHWKGHYIYLKEEQAIVEEANKEVMKHLRNFILMTCQ